jgi:hypothetical protein
MRGVGALAFVPGMGLGKRVPDRISSSSADSSAEEASSRVAARLGMRRFGLGEMISSGGTTTVAGWGGEENGAPTPKLTFTGRGGGVRAVKGCWTSSIESSESTSDGSASSHAGSPDNDDDDACYGKRIESGGERRAGENTRMRLPSRCRPSDCCAGCHWHCGSRAHAICLYSGGSGRRAHGAAGYRHRARSAYRERRRGSCERRLWRGGGVWAFSEMGNGVWIWREGWVDEGMGGQLVGERKGERGQAL